MTLEELQFDIKKVNHSMESRTEAVALIVKYPEILPEVIKRAFNNEKNHFKYCWWLEFLNRQYIEMLCPHIHKILKGATKLTNDSAIRPIAKIIETFVLKTYGKDPSSTVVDVMTLNVKELMVALSFEWLINEKLNVAAKAYSMTSLYYLGKDVSWVHEELQMVIEQNYAVGSAAYKARARMVLKKLVS